MRQNRSLTVMATLCLTSVACGLAADEPNSPTLSSIADLRSLSRAAIAETPRVRVRGVVTQVFLPAKSVFLQDDTAATYVNFSLAASRSLWPDEGIPSDVAAGVELEIEGVLDPGGFSPPILPTSVRVLGTKALPLPKEVEPVRFFAGADDSSLVVVSGIVQDAVARGQIWRLNLKADGQSFVADVPTSAVVPAEAKLINATVRVAGPAASVFNTRGEFIMPRIVVGRPDGFELVDPPPHEPFASPSFPIGALAGFQPQPPGDRMIRTEGVVVHADPGRVIYLQRGAGGVRVKTRSDLPLLPGDTVEVAGFLD